MTLDPPTIRQATVTDAEAIATAHRDSIQSLGPAFYAPNVVADWQDGISGALYARAMERGEVFFIATRIIEGVEVVLGFSTDYRIDGPQHGTSVYVRGSASRQGLGSTLLRTAEAHAVADCATSVAIEASLAGVEFYRANGYVELRRGETLLSSGRPIECVFMQKDLKSAQ